MNERDHTGIARNRSFLQAMERRIQRESDIKQKVRLCRIAAAFSSVYHPGVFLSSTIENTVTEIASSLQITSPKVDVKPNSFLHVMTIAYTAGGHTRVVERWTEKSPIGQTHSLILTAQGKREIPERLTNAVADKNGELIVLSARDDCDNALRLRDIASGYAHIILHIHPFDILPLLAFGTPDFKRPVIFYNHADHIFWLGLSISDIIADLSVKGQRITLDRRMASNSFILPVPLDCPQQLLTKSEARKRLNLPHDKKIVLSIGSSYKYFPSSDMNFPETAITLTRELKDLLVLVIGPHKDEKTWQNAARESNGKIKALGVIPHVQLNDYIMASDLYIDSFPFGAGTTVLEVGLSGVPVLSVDNGLTQFDSYQLAIVPYGNLVPAAKTVIEGGQVYDQERLIQGIKETHCDQGWLSNLEQLIQSTPANHSVKHIPQTELPMDDYDKRIYDLLRRIIDLGSAQPPSLPSVNLRNRLFIAYHLIKQNLLTPKLAITALKLQWKHHLSTPRVFSSEAD